MGLEHFIGIPYMQAVIWAIYLSLPSTIVIFQVFNLRELETLSFVHKRLLNEHNHIEMRKLVCFRVVMTFILIFPVFFITDEYFLYLMTGNFLSVAIGFAIPVC